MTWRITIWKTLRKIHIYTRLSRPAGNRCNVPHFRGRGKLHPDALAPCCRDHLSSWRKIGSNNRISDIFDAGRRLYTYQCKYYAFDKVHTAQHCYFVADSGRIYGNLHFKYSTVIFPIGWKQLWSGASDKMARFKETLTQMQIANDIRPEGFILRFNSLLFELLFQLLHNFSIQLFHQISVRRTKTVTGWIWS